MKKFIVTSLIVFFACFEQSIPKEKILMFTSSNNCKSCNNPVINALKYNLPFFDSLGYEYELILDCRRRRDLEDYRSYYNLDSNLNIVKMTDSISNIYIALNSDQMFVVTRNDTILFTSERLEALISYISK